MAKKIGNLQSLTHALDMALAATVERDKRRPGEFTAREFQARARECGSALSFEAVRKRLAALADKGQFASRVITEDGRAVRVYSAPGA
jgi:hypothetical protein